MPRVPRPTHTLVLLRHAKSDWSGGEPDVDRPLANRGRRQAPEAGRWLASSLDRVDLAVVSPARRAQSTWELASAELGPRPETRVDERVYAATGEELLDVVRGLSGDHEVVVLVGHNPGLEDLLTLLTDEWERLPTSAIAVVDVTGPWSGAGRASASLRTAGRPPGG